MFPVSSSVFFVEEERGECDYCLLLRTGEKRESRNEVRIYYQNKQTNKQTRN